MGDLENPRLHELQAIAGTGLHAEDDSVGAIGDVGFRLSDTNCLQQHDIVERAQQNHGGDGGFGEAAQPVARRHGAHVDTRIFRVARHPRAVAQ